MAEWGCQKFDGGKIKRPQNFREVVVFPLYGRKCAPHTKRRDWPRSGSAPPPPCAGACPNLPQAASSACSGVGTALISAPEDEEKRVALGTTDGAGTGMLVGVFVGAGMGTSDGDGVGG